MRAACWIGVLGLDFFHAVWSDLAFLAHIGPISDLSIGSGHPKINVSLYNVYMHWVVQSCQSLAGPAKLQVLVRGEAGANGRVVFVGPADLPPLSSGPPQQIDSPAGRHGAHHGPMLRAHMPRSTNSHLHTNMHAHTNICMYEDTCLPVDRNKQTCRLTNTNLQCTHSV